jgi:hypothetical protein
VRLRAQVLAESADAASKPAVVKLRRSGEWLRVSAMRFADGTYAANVRLGNGHGWRRLGRTRVGGGRSVLRLRAYVRGVGASNLVVVRVGR